MLETTKYKGDRPSTNAFKCVKLQLGGIVYGSRCILCGLAENPLSACMCMLCVCICVLGKTHGRYKYRAILPDGSLVCRYVIGMYDLIVRNVRETCAKLSIQWYQTYEFY